MVFLIWENMNNDHRQCFSVNKLLSHIQAVEEILRPITFSLACHSRQNYWPKKTTLVGTIRGNKREIPKAAKQTKDNMPRFSTLLYKSEDCVLTINKSKPNKRVAVLGSQHKFVKIDKSNKKMLPESIQFYNSTKFGVDMADQMARKYTVKASSRRWPLQIFFNILDLAAVNAWILYKETTGIRIQRKSSCFN
jgi:hypothetical protein